MVAEKLVHKAQKFVLINAHNVNELTCPFQM